ncbi:hypothetical protein BDW66DRAFT_88258 [Aspergillus desertorum]
MVQNDYCRLFLFLPSCHFISTSLSLPWTSDLSPRSRDVDASAYDLGTDCLIVFYGRGSPPKHVFHRPLLGQRPPRGKPWVSAPI